MSVEAMAVVLHHSRARGTDKMVLLGIANHEGDGGAWPTVATLARYANRSERAVQYSIVKLVELREVVVEYQQGGLSTTRADRRPNRYRITLACPEICDGSTAHRVRGETNVTPSADGVQPTAPVGVQPTAPEPSLQPSLEQTTSVRSPAQQVLDDIKDALVEIGLGPTQRSGWAIVNRVATMIRDRGCGPADVAERAALMAVDWGPSKVTLTSLEKHWARYDPGKIGRLSPADVEQFKRDQDKRSRTEQRQLNVEEYHAEMQRLKEDR